MRLQVGETEATQFIIGYGTCACGEVQQRRKKEDNASGSRALPKPSLSFFLTRPPKEAGQDVFET